MDESSRSEVGSPPRGRISLKTCLIGMAFFALICAFVVQRLELVRTRTSLARYETSLIPTELQSEEFRVVAREVVLTSNVKVIAYRIETTDPHNAKIRIGSDSNSAQAKYDARMGLYVTDALVFIDHVESAGVMKVMASVSGARGYSVYQVAEDFSLDAELRLNDLNAVYPRDEGVELLSLEGKKFELKLKP